MAFQAPLTIAGETRNYWILSHWNIQRRQINTVVEVEKITSKAMRDVEIYVDEKINGKMERVKKTVQREVEITQGIETPVRTEVNIETAVWHCWPSAEVYAANRVDGANTGRVASVESHWCAQTNRILSDGVTVSGNTAQVYTNHKDLLSAVLGENVEDV